MIPTSSIIDSIDDDTLDVFHGIFFGYGTLSLITTDLSDEQFFNLLCAFASQELGSTLKIDVSCSLAAYIILYNKTNIWLKFLNSSYSETPKPFFYFGSFYSAHTFELILSIDPTKLNDLLNFCTLNHHGIYFFSDDKGRDYESIHRYFTLLYKPSEQTAIFEKFIIDLFSHFNLKTMKLYDPFILRDYCQHLIFLSTLIVTTDNASTLKNYFDFDFKPANTLIVDFFYNEYIVKKRRIIGFQYHALFKELFSLPQYSSHILSKHLEEFFQYCDFDSNIKHNPEFFVN
jgi:hypothetical protein